jgi:AraC-like DNA-binding protein
MSMFHFARLFKASTGLSPHRFIVARRLDRAKALLTTDVAPVAAIGRTVGFRTPSHFTTVFRRSTGMTPSVYRWTAPAPGPPPVASGSPSVEPSPGHDPDGRSV